MEKTFKIIDNYGTLTPIITVITDVEVMVENIGPKKVKMGLYIDGEIDAERNDAMIVYYPALIIDEKVYYIDFPIMEEDFFDINDDVIIIDNNKNIFNIIRNTLKSFETDQHDPSIMKWVGVDGYSRQVSMKLDNRLKLSCFSDHDDSFKLPINNVFIYESFDKEDHHTVYNFAIINTQPVNVVCDVNHIETNSLIALYLDSTCEWVCGIMGIKTPNRFE